ncbi:YciI family protein [Winogradskyella sp. 3972H.M.0a.05]|uniref:YciI family protein n=1 Tax=Winogradskyella sp. 3972H.M.0a.05 TaxID=2950277 RepID=UPI003391C388
MKTILFTLLLSICIVGCKHKEHTHEHDGDKHHKHEHKSEHEHHGEKHHHDNDADHKSMAQVKKELTEKGFQVMDFVDEETQDTILMQQYFIAFLKSGPSRSQSEEEKATLQAAHMTHLARMYEEGYADISGPFGDDGEIRGITIYNVPTQKMADSLANLDPMVKAGRLVIETHPWWAAKGFPLR